MRLVFAGTSPPIQPMAATIPLSPTCKEIPSTLLAVLGRSSWDLLPYGRSWLQLHLHEQKSHTLLLTGASPSPWRFLISPTTCISIPYFQIQTFLTRESEEEMKMPISSPTFAGASIVGGWPGGVPQQRSSKSLDLRDLSYTGAQIILGGMNDRVWSFPNGLTETIPNLRI